eukprot:3216753-Prymnesium_polylepis.2
MKAVSASDASGSMVRPTRAGAAMLSISRGSVATSSFLSGAAQIRAGRRLAWRLLPRTGPGGGCHADATTPPVWLALPAALNIPAPSRPRAAGGRSGRLDGTAGRLDRDGLAADAARVAGVVRQADEARLAPVGAPRVAHLPVGRVRLLVVADQLHAVVNLARPGRALLGEDAALVLVPVTRLVLAAVDAH